MEVVVSVATGSHEVAAHGHVAHFYRHHADLAERAGDYLAAGVADGGVALTMATPEHRLAVEERMAGAGVDVSAARASGDYLALDAEETLNRLVSGSRPDRARFELVIGGLIHRATSCGRAVRACGELAAMLWEAGLVAGAIEFEELWNSLGRRYPCGLWCAYPAAQMATGGLADSITDVCTRHALIIGDVPGRPGPAIPAT